MASPVSAGALRKLLNEIAASTQREHALAVGGAVELAPCSRRFTALRARCGTDCPELAATLAPAFALRAVAREARGLMPGAGWAVRPGCPMQGRVQ